MSLSKEEVKKVAKLAKFKMNEAELDKYCLELNQIFDWIAQLNEIDTTHVKPLVSVHEDAALLLRKDLPQPLPSVDELLSNSKHAKYGYFTVPKVIE